VTSLAFDGTGGRLLTASSDQTARLWTLDAAAHRAEEAQVLVGHRGEVCGASFDADCQLAVTGCQDGVVRVFDLAGGDELKHLELGQRVMEAVFDRPGRRVFARTADGRVAAWHLDGERATVSLRQEVFVRAVAFTGDGQQLVAGDDNGHVDVWHARDGQRLKRVLPRLDKSVRALDVDPKSRRVVVATESGSVAFYSLLDGSRIGALPGHRQSVVTARFSADGERVVTASDDGTASVVDARDASQLCQVQVGGRAVAAALSPDGALLATVAAGAAAATLWSVPAGARLREVGGGGAPPAAVLFLPDGRSLLLAGTRGACRCSVDGALEQSYPADIGIGCAAIDRAGRKLLLCSNDPLAPVAQIWDLQAGALLLRCTSHRGPLLACALDADGAYAATASKDRTVQVWPTDPVEIAKKLNPRPLTAADRLKLSLPPPRTTPPK
jgi:WD40 repeat protein